MPKLNVYVSESLSARIREAGIAVSAACQRALEEEVRRVEAHRAADERVRRMAERFRSTRSEVRPDDTVRESEGYTAGMEWASNVATMHELASVAGARGDREVHVFRELGSLDQALANAGVGTDSETNRVLSPDDPWSRGFLKACQEMWRRVQPLM